MDSMKTCTTPRRNTEKMGGITQRSHKKPCYGSYDPDLTPSRE